LEPFNYYIGQFYPKVFCIHMVNPMIFGLNCKVSKLAPKMNE